MADQGPQQRVVLLGASNLTRGLGTVLSTLNAMYGGPVDVFSALGRGRSYGLRASLLWRSLPGILQCGIWEALAARPQLPTTALITDIGNDLLYQASVDNIVTWVERCCDRLAPLAERLALTGLPICNLQKISNGRFLFFRSLFVPGCRLSRDEVIARATELQERLRLLAQERGIGWVEQQPEWFGIDPIHFRRRAWPAAWKTILAPLQTTTATSQDTSLNGAGGETQNNSPRTPLLGVKIWLAAPQERAFFGHVQQGAQPCLKLRNGTQVSLY